MSLNQQVRTDLKDLQIMRLKNKIPVRVVAEKANVPESTAWRALNLIDPVSSEVIKKLETKRLIGPEKMNYGEFVAWASSTLN